MINSKFRKTICFVLNHYYKDMVGGSEKQALYIARELLKRGWDVHYVRESYGIFPKNFNDYGIHLYSLPQSGLYKRLNLQGLINGFYLKMYLQYINPNIIYNRAGDYLLIKLCESVKNIYNKLIWHCCHDDQVTKKHEKVFDTRSQIKFEYILKRTKTNIFQTNYQKSMARTNYGVDGFTINNGHHIKNEIKIKKRKKNILWVGRLQAWKHPEKFAELSKMLLYEGYNFFILGLPQNKLVESEIIKQAENIECLNYLSSCSASVVEDWMAKSKLLINTSDSEGFSNTFIEAWLNGVPVISYKVDPDNVIKNNNLGRISGSLSNTKEDVIELMENESEWKKCSDSCITYARENHNIKNIVDQLENKVFI